MARAHAGKVPAPTSITATSCLAARKGKVHVASAQDTALDRDIHIAMESPDAERASHFF